MTLAVSVEPVKATPAMRGSATAFWPTTEPRPGMKLQHVTRHTGLVQQAHRLRTDQRGLFGGLGEHRIAGSQRRSSSGR